MPNPLFKLGRCVATPGANAAMADSNESPILFLGRHAGGDWGECCEKDKAVNDSAVNGEARIMSVYLTSKGVKLWVITEWDRSATTVLLPDEY